jgi:hypothetical protein
MRTHWNLARKGFFANEAKSDAYNRKCNTFVR